MPSQTKLSSGAPLIFTTWRGPKRGLQGLCEPYPKPKDRWPILCPLPSPEPEHQDCMVSVPPGMCVLVHRRQTGCSTKAPLCACHHCPMLPPTLGLP